MWGSAQNFENSEKRFLLHDTINIETDFYEA